MVRRPPHPRRLCLCDPSEDGRESHRGHGLHATLGLPELDLGTSPASPGWLCAAWDGGEMGPAAPRAAGEGSAGRTHPCGWESVLPPPHLPRRIPSALDNSLLHAIETIIIDWSHQIRDVLSKDSAQPLLDGLHPLPRVEFEFWDARLMNLKYIHEQVTVSPPCRGDPVSVALQPRAHGPARPIPKPCSPLRGPPGRWRGPREPARGSPGLQRPWGKASFAWGLRVPLERLMFLFSVSAEQAQSEQNS